MSSYGDLFRIEDCVVADCPLYRKTFFSPILLVGDFYPLVLNIGMYAISLFRFEIYLFVLSACLTGNMIINFFISKVLVESPNRFHNCGSPYQMPSLSSDHIVFFTTAMLTFVIMWRHQTISSLRILMLEALFLFVLTSRVYIGINWPSELILGALLGFIEALIFQTVFYYWLYPWTRPLVKRFQWLGLSNELLVYQMPSTKATRHVRKK